MHAGSCQAAALLWVGTATLLCSLPAWALQPPRPGDVARYKQDGTWSKRLAEAKALGNHRTDPALVFRARQKLQQIAPAPAGTAVELDASLALPPRWQGGLPTTGNPKVIVLLVSFPDEREVAGQEPADVLSKSFGNGDAGQYPYESLRNYYQRSSYSQLTIGGNVLGWYVAAYDRSHYSTLGGASGREALIKEALDYYNPSHDFSQYDNDGDGNIDALYIKWTGPDNGWANFWWACQATWYVNSSYRVDGKGLYKYVWSWF